MKRRLKTKGRKTTGVKTSSINRIFLMILSIVLVLALMPLETHGASEVIRRGPGDERRVALTFDDGYDPAKTDEVLDVLAAYDIAATFFLNGEAIEDYPEQARRVVNEGHELANHSYSHRDFTQLSGEEIFEEISLTERAAKEVTGINIGEIFRVPYGSFNQDVLDYLQKAGYSYSIQWTIDPRDWEGPPPEAIHEQVMREMQPGAIVVLHVNHDAVNTALALPRIIEDLTRQGYEFVTVSEMIFGKGKGEVHIVQSGETLNAIAKQYGITVDVLVRINDLKNPNVIDVGQELLLPKGIEADLEQEKEPDSEATPESDPDSETDSGTDSDTDSDTNSDPDPTVDRSYSVRPGDSLHQIAKEFEISLEDLVIANRIQKAESVFIGQTLTIPGESPKPEEEGPEEEKWLNPEDYKRVWLEAEESFYGLASDYRVTLEQLLNENGDINRGISVNRAQIQLQ